MVEQSNSLLLCSIAATGTKQLDFVHVALCAEGSNAAPHYFTALHSWQVVAPDSSNTAPSSASAAAAALYITLQRCTTDGTPVTPPVPVLRLPPDAWSHPAALRACASPERDTLLVNGRPFLTSLHALGMLSPYCDACASSKVDGGLLDGHQAGSFKSFEEGMEAVEALWSAVLANVAIHKQQPEEVLLLMLVLNAARLAGESDTDLGRLPPLEAYGIEQGDHVSELSHPHGVAHYTRQATQQQANAMVAAVATQALQLVRWGTQPWDTAAGQLQTAALLVLELADFGNTGLVSSLLQRSHQRMVLKQMVPSWILGKAPRAVLRLLGGGLARHSNVSDALEMRMLGFGLLYAVHEAALPALLLATDARAGLAMVTAAPAGKQQDGMLEALARMLSCDTIREALHCIQAAASGSASGATISCDLSTATAANRPVGEAGSARSAGSAPRPPDADGAGAEPPRQAAAAYLVEGAVWCLKALTHAYLARWQDIRPASCAALALQPASPAAPAPTDPDAADHCLLRARWRELVGPSGAGIRDASPPAHHGAKLLRSGGSSLLTVPSQAAQRDDDTACTLGAVLRVLDLALGELCLDDVMTHAPVLGELLAPLLGNLEYSQHALSLLRVLAQLAAARSPRAAGPAPVQLQAPAQAASAASTLLQVPEPGTHPTTSPSAGAQLWNGVRAGLAACGYNSDMDLLHALLLTGALEARGIEPAGTSAASLQIQDRLLGCTLQTLELVLSALTTGTADWSHADGDEGSAQRSAACCVVFFLWQGLRCSMMWRQQAASASEEQLQKAQRMGEAATQALSVLGGPLVARHLPQPLNEHVQVLMSFLAATTRAASGHLPAAKADALDNTLRHMLELLSGVIGDNKDVASAVAAAQGVPRLLHALSRASTPQALCAAGNALLAACEHGPPDTLGTLVACRGMQTTTRHLLLPPVGLLLAPDTGPDPEQQCRLRTRWLEALRCGCDVLPKIVGDQKAAAEQFWDALSPQLANMLQHLAAARRSGQGVDVEAKAVIMVLLSANGVLTIHHHNDQSTWIFEKFVEAGFTELLMSTIRGLSADDIPVASKVSDAMQQHFHAQYQSVLALPRGLTNTVSKQSTQFTKLRKTFVAMSSHTASPLAREQQDALNALDVHLAKLAMAEAGNRMVQQATKTGHLGALQVPAAAAAAAPDRPMDTPSAVPATRERKGRGRRGEGSSESGATAAPDAQAAQAAADAAMQALLQEEDEEHQKRAQVAAAKQRRRKKGARPGGGSPQTASASTTAGLSCSSSDSTSVTTSTAPQPAGSTAASDALGADEPEGHAHQKRGTGVLATSHPDTATTPPPCASAEQQAPVPAFPHATPAQPRPSATQVAGGMGPEAAPVPEPLQAPAAAGFTRAGNRRLSTSAAVQATALRSPKAQASGVDAEQHMAAGVVRAVSQPGSFHSAAGPVLLPMSAPHTGAGEESSRGGAVDMQELLRTLLPSAADTPTVTAPTLAVPCQPAAEPQRHASSLPAGRPLPAVATPARHPSMADVTSSMPACAAEWPRAAHDPEPGQAAQPVRQQGIAGATTVTSDGGGVSAPGDLGGGSSRQLRCAAAGSDPGVSGSGNIGTDSSSCRPVAPAGGGGPLRVLAPLEDLLCCPITRELVDDPVICADGHTYKRAALANWLSRNAISPLTGQALAHTGLTPNYAVRGVIESLRQM